MLAIFTSPLDAYLRYGISDAHYKYESWAKKPRAVNGLEDRGEEVEVDTVNIS